MPKLHIYIYSDITIVYILQCVSFCVLLGFAAFAFILAFIFFTGVAIYGSPLFCGSQQEKSAVRATVVHQNAAG